MASTTVVFLLFAGAISLGGATEFLKEPPNKVLNEHLSEEEIRISILEEIEGTFGVGSVSSRLAQLEASLKQMYAALPKNEYGRLGHSTVRYTLHRLFILRHGWDIRGLGGRRGVENTTATPGVLKAQAPSYIQDMFEKRLGGRGLGLHDLAVFASAIENLIHTETVSKLSAVFDVHAMSPTNLLTEAEANEVMDTYMMAFILGENLTSMSLDEAKHLKDEMPETFGHWSETQKFVRKIRENVTRAHGPFDKDQAYLDFSVLAKVAEEVGEKFGTFQDTECQHMKESLMRMETSGTGRVKLSDFYKPALANPDGSWQFQESVAYLRQLGLLDEWSNPKEGSVMIANYLLSSNNCIASSGFYSVCCKDECEALLGHLETQVAAPETKPATIVDIIKALPSSTVPAPREISGSMLQLLDDIAATHGGVVPLHGRLFAQWMHHAYPRECPYPHLSGTVSQQSPEEWLEDNDDVFATQEEMSQFAPAANTTGRNTEVGGDMVEELLWSPEEELLVERSVWSPVDGDPKKASVPPFVRGLMLFAMSGSFALAVLKTVTMPSQVDGKAGSKLFV